MKNLLPLFLALLLSACATDPGALPTVAEFPGTPFAVGNEPEPTTAATDDPAVTPEAGALALVTDEAGPTDTPPTPGDPAFTLTFTGLDEPPDTALVYATEGGLTLEFRQADVLRVQVVVPLDAQMQIAPGTYVLTSDGMSGITAIVEQNTRDGTLTSIATGGSLTLDSVRPYSGRFRFEMTTLNTNETGLILEGTFSALPLLES